MAATTHVERLGAFVSDASFDQLSAAGAALRTGPRCSTARSCGISKVDTEVFGWYIKNYGPEVNLFVDHSQIVQLECLRRGVWGAKSSWGLVVTCPGE